MKGKNSKVILVEELNKLGSKAFPSQSPATASKTCCVCFNYSQAHDSIVAKINGSEVDPTRIAIRNWEKLN